MQRRDGLPRSRDRDLLAARGAVDDFTASVPELSDRHVRHLGVVYHA
jgi:hypothetical protein